MSSPPMLETYQANADWGQFSAIVGENRVSPAVGDVDGDGVVNVSDVVNLINQMLNSH